MTHRVHLLAGDEGGPSLVFRQYQGLTDRVEHRMASIRFLPESELLNSKLIGPIGHAGQDWS